MAATIGTTDGVTVSGANVVTADIEASNGVVHVIDSVILPGAIVEADAVVARSVVQRDCRVHQGQNIIDSVLSTRGLDVSTGRSNRHRVGIADALALQGDVV